jgi:hypothetical protein
MPGDEEPSPLTEANRKYLEAFLEQVRGASLPGSGKLIKSIEKTLGRKSNSGKPGSDGQSSRDGAERDLGDGPAQ